MGQGVIRRENAPPIQDIIKPLEQKGLMQIDMADIIAKADRLIHKTYLQDMNGLDIVSCPKELMEEDCDSISRFFKVERFVTEKNENTRDKLVSVFQAVACFKCALIVLINSNETGIDYYFGTRVIDIDDSNSLSHAAEALIGALKGNFPGTEIRDVSDKEEQSRLFKCVFTKEKLTEQVKEICTVAGIAGIRSKDETPQKLFVQGMEKLIDSMQGKRYSLLVIADPVTPGIISRMKDGYEQFASQLSMIEEISLTYGSNESSTDGTNLSASFSRSVNKSISDTLSFTESSSQNYSSGSQNKRRSEGTSRGSAESRQKSQNKQKGESDQWQKQAGYSKQNTNGKSESWQVKLQNYAIKELKKKLEKQLERINTSADLGMWNCATYCLADDEHTVRLLASLYQSLLRGENFSIELSTVTKWDEEQSIAILPWLKKMNHPHIITNLDEYSSTDITPSSCVHSAELAIHAGIPQHSVSGLPVLQMVPFGRETINDWNIQDNKKNNIQLGNIHHLGKDEAKPVHIDIDRISEHVFITGSTGTGKSNTIYHLINELMKKKINFLVIEPTKGEYKNVFGGCENVKVYGTNDKIMPLLKLNPFYFPDSIHVIEHIERLMEIFNICWPMEQAMPVVLKKAVIAAYEEAGWDIAESKAKIDSFPNFKRVGENIKKVIEKSKWSSEIKGNYEGALVTRLESLTNSIYSKIFTNKKENTSPFFNDNVIIDLSRIGSNETKSLIMGILLIMLQEHRIDSRSVNSEGTDEPLNHITILEEAHNLLKRVSPDHGGGSSNTAAKAVEMLSNAIAEMRTYGEGFIIVDQAPGLLDMAVIRNTNTKIIHKLPDKSDRELVGLSAMLNEDQITEMARLQRGVAAVYQSNWIEPVLCKVTHFKKENFKAFKFKGGKNYV